jgi:molybdopterin-guanine dinucleotide biosynthesis protein A
MRDQADSEGEGTRGGDGSPRVLGLVLAGGRSLRMGREKALVSVAGQPMLARVLARFAPQVTSVALNANGDPARFAGFRVPVVPDAPGPPAGPLAGIAAGLRLAAERGYALLATCPADAPFLPADLVGRLAGALGHEASAPPCMAMAAGPEGLEPLFGLWRVDALRHVEKALAEGRFAVREVAAEAGRREVAFDAGPPPGCFANLNTPGDLAAAEALLAG